VVRARFGPIDDPASKSAPLMLGVDIPKRLPGHALATDQSHAGDDLAVSIFDKNNRLRQFEFAPFFLDFGFVEIRFAPFTYLHQIEELGSSWNVVHRRSHRTISIRQRVISFWHSPYPFSQSRDFHIRSRSPTARNDNNL